MGWQWEPLSLRLGCRGGVVGIVVAIACFPGFESSSTAFSFNSLAGCMYRRVISIDACPANSWMTEIGTPASPSRLQKVWRSWWNVMCTMPEILTARRNEFLTSPMCSPGIFGRGKDPLPGSLLLLCKEHFEQHRIQTDFSAFPGSGFRLTNGQHPIVDIGPS